MSLLDIFHTPKLKPAWIYQTTGVIWRLLPSEKGVLIGESRDLEKKQVSFFCLDASDGQPFWQGRTFDEQWWISIEQLYRDVLFFHEFATPDLPEHKKVYAVDSKTSKVLWVNEEVQFAFARAEAVYVSKVGFETRRYYEVDLYSGNVLREISSEEASALQSIAGQETTSLQFPLTVEGTEPWITGMKSAVSKIIQSSIHTEYIEQGDKFVLSVYLQQKQEHQESPMLNQEIFILDNKGNELYHEMINGGMRYPVPDAFLCINDTLYFIKEKMSLVAIKIPKNSAWQQ